MPISWINSIAIFNDLVLGIAYITTICIKK